MNARRASDLHRVTMDLAAHARESHDGAEYRHQVLAALCELVGCDQAVFAVPSAEEPLTTYNVDTGAIRIIRYCEQNFAHYLPEVAPLMTEARRSRGVVDSEFFSSDERDKLSFYADIVRPQGISSILMLLPQWRGDVLGMIRMERRRGTPLRATHLALATRVLTVVELSLAALRGDGPRQRVPLPKLSGRETEIAEHVARGLTTPQIALLLGTSRLTVRNQIGRIFDKIGVASRAELAGWVTRQQTSITY
jgi:DNA-binding CsgD family transcriptional regulator